MGRIDTQLDIIRLNRYGEDVRGAIHDALDILEKTSGGSGGNEPYNAVLFGGVTLTATITNMETEE